VPAQRAPLPRSREHHRDQHDDEDDEDGEDGEDDDLHDDLHDDADDDEDDHADPDAELDLACPAPHQYSGGGARAHTQETTLCTLAIWLLTAPGISIETASSEAIGSHRKP
jgi:ABC-type Zn2+ transport system substrate-binding protein/surface adhesin